MYKNSNNHAYNSTKSINLPDAERKQKTDMKDRKMQLISLKFKINCFRKLAKQIFTNCHIK